MTMPGRTLVNVPSPSTMSAPDVDREATHGYLDNRTRREMQDTVVNRAPARLASARTDPSIGASETDSPTLNTWLTPDFVTTIDQDPRVRSQTLSTRSPLLGYTQETPAKHTFTPSTEHLVCRTVTVADFMVVNTNCPTSKKRNLLHRFGTRTRVRCGALCKHTT